MKKILGIMVLGLLLSVNAYAQCYEKYGKTICAPPGGTIMEKYGRYVCGKGQCVEKNGRIYCSNESFGKAMIKNNRPICTGGCREAHSNFCDIPS